MDTCFAVPIRVSYPVRWRRAVLGQSWPVGTTPGSSRTLALVVLVMS